MAFIDYGSQKTDRPKTPTLREYHKKNGNSPNRSSVVIIFKPNKAPNYSLVTDHGFRVSVLEDNPLHGILTDSLEDWSKVNTFLAVQVDNGEKGEWTLVGDTDRTSVWEVFDWGYKLQEEKPSTRTRKAARSDA